MKSCACESGYSVVFIPMQLVMRSILHLLQTKVGTVYFGSYSHHLAHLDKTHQDVLSAPICVFVVAQIAILLGQAESSKQA